MAIQPLACQHALALYETGRNRRLANIAKAALRKLDMLDAARRLDDLRAPPGNRLESLLGDRSGLHSG